ncbi:hypothetical protein ILUMI_03888, partial [Ignelater luminosus]
RVQDLAPSDYEHGVRFCEWLLELNLRNVNFPMNVLACDEFTFTRNGIINFYNMHYWDAESPHTIHRFNYQQRSSINVFAECYANRSIYLVPPNDWENVFKFSAKRPSKAARRYFIRCPSAYVVPT